MELSQLEAFLAVADRQNITKAAEFLHITQPSLSKTIMRLEEELGLKLFDRNGKRITLNENGVAMCAYARSTLNLVEDMQSVAAARKNEQIGVLTVGSSYPPTATDFIGEALFRLHCDYPDVKILFRQITLSKLKTALENKEIDLAISTFPIGSNGICFDELFSERIGVILSKKHPLAKRKTLCLRDLRNERFFTYETVENLQDATRTVCNLAGFEPNIFIRSDYPIFITRAISHSGGVALITRGDYLYNTHYDIEHRGKDITYRPIQDPFSRRVCGLAYLENLYYPSYVVHFRNLLREEACKIVDENEKASSMTS